MQKAETAIQRPCQVTTSQVTTEKGDSLQEAETWNLEETLREDVSSNTLIETMPLGLTQPKDIRMR